MTIFAIILYFQTYDSIDYFYSGIIRLIAGIITLLIGIENYIVKKREYYILVHPNYNVLWNGDRHFTELTGALLHYLELISSSFSYGTKGAG
ncbi:hypothetical protein [Peribacillus frigoritolerans]|uniref:hypothetical protein n=1 Tax=Peribacillus frigoritolerans TaxID=450367 RepID=UPI00207A8599|nr:hypothetical protein [Peribacillus frigoritolerans]MEE3953486.1 hypothetical protein [Peribacillus frigoritolerans]USK63456.1 hypothetical protein LIT26_19800 [Peribacillus frigoritolerans]